MFLRSLELPGNKMQTSHVATLVILFLSICCLHMRRSLAARDDGRPYVCDLSQTSHLPCCHEPLVLLNSVKFYVEPTGNEETPWNVTATVNWSPPTKTDIYQYSIDLFPSVIVADLVPVDDGKAKCAYTSRNLCSNVKSSTCPKQFFFDVVTNDTSAVIGDLLFGHAYQVRIQAKRNGLIAAQHLCQVFTDQFLGDVTASHLITSPDCYNITGNATYCEQQATVPTASIPRDLNVQLDLYDSKYAFINITWKEPLFVNGEVADYKIQFARKINETTFYQDYEETASKDDRSLTVTDWIRLRSNYQVWIRAIVRLPPSYGLGFDAVQDGNLAMLEFNTSPPISSSTTTAFQTTRRITPTSKTTTTWPTEVYVVFAAFALLTPVVIMAIVIFICRSSKRKTPRFENRPLHFTRKKENVIISPEFQTHEIFHVFDVILGDPIGQGQFGEVYIAKWRQKKGDNEEITVAVKTTKENLKPALKEQFLDEIRLMIEIGNHPNIMAILGCRTVAEPYYLIIEYMKYGSLKEYLTKSNDVELVMKDQSYDLTEIRQLQISHQISKGMEYLESQKFFHGDLAARNILLGEHLEVKISDFGFANNIQETGYARLPEESKRPVKWYSPEALLTGKCSSAGDVWSFGIVLYEIYSRGEEPYIGMLPREVLTRLLAGYRMDKPEDCSQHIYELMLDCWDQEPSARPVFHDIKKTLEGFLANISGDAYIDPLNGDHSDDDDQETVSGITVT